jgi:hypothetical protein
VLYYLGDKYHAPQVEASYSFKRMDGGGADFAGATDCHRNGFLAYLLACTMLGSLNIPMAKVKDLNGFMHPTSHG